MQLFSFLWWWMRIYEINYEVGIETIFSLLKIIDKKYYKFWDYMFEYILKNFKEITYAEHMSKQTSHSKGEIPNIWDSHGYLIRRAWFQFHHEKYSCQRQLKVSTYLYKMKHRCISSVINPCNLIGASQDSVGKLY